jgi:hypothetical protein
MKIKITIFTLIIYIMLSVSIVNCQEPLSYYNTMYCEEIKLSNNPFEELSKALYTSMITKKKIGMLIIVEHSNEWETVDKIKQIISYYNLPITLFVRQHDLYEKN